MYVQAGIGMVAGIQ